MTSSKQRNLAAFTLGFFECILFGGLKYGWASLVFILKDLGYFYKCSNKLPIVHTINDSAIGTSSNLVTSSGIYEIVENTTNQQTTDCTNESIGVCRTQDSCLHLVFTIASVSCGVMAIPAGPLVDKCSIRLPRLIFR